MCAQAESASSRSQCMVDDHWDDATVILSCTGTLDVLTAVELERRIASALDKRPTAVIVDLSGVDFLASHGMSVLVATAELCSATVGFSVVADGPATSRPMQLIGLTDIITVHATLTDALQDLRA